MFSQCKQIYLATRKQNDQLFNSYVMRPLASVAVFFAARTPVTPNQLTLLSLIIFIVGAALLIALPGTLGALIGALVIELNYLLDCADGMLARHKKLASRQGHLFDFFTDEIKAVILVGALAVRCWRFGGLDYALEPLAAGHQLFLLAGMVGVFAVASATSLTTFLRHPEITGKRTPVEAHYEANRSAQSKSPLRWAVQQLMTFLRLINHYPSHIYLFAAFDRLDLYFWLWSALNVLYLLKGWLAIALRFGRS
ncbi:MAG: CDP-alcohol phosphatidyltransferase family protein [Deltaproteobacteria bacterium]|nr:CDP-alcohol phosphatidyltransferase family protein [Deltaproteobacteria bacterium]